MISIKNEKELATMEKGGEICAKAMEKALLNIRVGRKKKEIDQTVRKEIERLRGRPSFMTVPNYHWTTCVTFNEEVVHGVPNENQVKEGDIVSVDLGVVYQGFHTDMARTVAVGKIDKKTNHFLKVGKWALSKATEKARVGGRVGDISKTIQEIVENEGYSVVRALTGHGIGRALHEDPYVPGFAEVGTTPELVEGMTLAIEVIYTMGGYDVLYKGNDGWTIATVDGSLAALFEDTVALTKFGPVVLTAQSQN